MLPSEVFLVWAAGFFDGEGSVFVQMARASSCRRGMRTILVASVSQTSLPCLNMLKERFGGTLTTSKKFLPHATNQSVAYIWSVRNAGAIKFLEAISPYAVVKKEQIDVALTYPLTDPNGPIYRGRRIGITDEVHNQRLAIGQRLRDIRAGMKTARDSTEEGVDA